MYSGYLFFKVLATYHLIKVAFDEHSVKLTSPHIFPLVIVLHPLGYLLHYIFISI